MKKISILVLVLVVTLSFSCCGIRSVEQNGQANKAETSTNSETDKQLDFKGLTEYKSTLGFQVKYDATAFGQSFENGTETFEYKAEEVASPVYIAVQVYPDTDTETMVEGLTLQAGTDDVLVHNTRFGAESIDTKGVYYTKKVNDIEQIFSFHVATVPGGNGVVVIEAVGYAGQSEKADSKMEELLANLSLK